ncbi:catalase-related domain-containing protein, partial [Pseudoalteromonas sp. MMG012]|uniref:catalase-related domain-containing protein n=1 Tax=Pseudoalteromonas sp. MMG012 TaxID=2822686 RepID=UPI001B6C711C
NAPKCPVHNYQRDGAFAGVCPFSDPTNSGNNSVNFYPNDRIDAGAPSPDPTVAEPPMPLAKNAWVKPHDQDHEDYYTQAGDLFRLMSPVQRRELADNIAGGLSLANEDIQQRMLTQFAKADEQYMLAVKTALAAQD